MIWYSPDRGAGVPGVRLFLGTLPSMNQFLGLTHEEGPGPMKQFPPAPGPASQLDFGYLTTVVRLSREFYGRLIFKLPSSGSVPASVILPDVSLVCKL